MPRIHELTRLYENIKGNLFVPISAFVAIKNWTHYVVYLSGG